MNVSFMRLLVAQGGFLVCVADTSIRLRGELWVVNTNSRDSLPVKNVLEEQTVWPWLTQENHRWPTRPCGLERSVWHWPSCWIISACYILRHQTRKFSILHFCQLPPVRFPNLHASGIPKIRRGPCLCLVATCWCIITAWKAQHRFNRTSAVQLKVGSHCVSHKITTK